MNDTLGVSVINCIGQPLEKVCNLIGRQTFFTLMQLAQVCRERWPPQKFHDNIWMPIDRIEIKDLDDIRMAQAGYNSCLPMKPFNKKGILFDVTVQQLDSNRTLQREVRT